MQKLFVLKPDLLCNRKTNELTLYIMQKFTSIKRLISFIFLGFYFVSTFHFELVHLNSPPTKLAHNHESSSKVFDYLDNPDPCTSCLAVNNQNFDQIQISLSNLQNSTNLFSDNNNNSYSRILISNKRLRAPPLSPA